MPTDFIVPYGVLAQSGLADVVALSAKPGNDLEPNPKIEGDWT